MCRSARFVCLALLLPVLGERLARAERSSDDRELAALDGPPVLALPLAEAPGATTVITAEEIARSGAANIFELLRRVPGVDIRYTPMGGHIGIRASGASPFSEQVLLLIDGAPYNSPDKGGFPGHPNYTGFFPLDRIARVEIVKGPISVLYGANAFAGVVNIVSKKPADAVLDRVDGLAVAGRALGGERGTLERRGRFELIKSGWEATLDAGAADGQTPIRLNGDATHSRSDVYGAVQRGNFRVSALHQQARYGSFDFLDTTTRPASNNVDIVDAHYGRRWGGWTVQGAATLNRYRGTTCAVCHNNQSGPPDDAVTADVGRERETDQRLRLAGRADRTLTDRQDLTFGFEASRDSVERRIVVQSDAPAVRFQGGFYLQHQAHLRRRSLHILSGLRLDGAEGLGPALSPRLAVVAELSGGVVLRGSWSRAYRTPTWNERFIRQRFLPEELAPGLILVFQGNPALERERNESTGVGVSWRVSPPLSLQLDLYHDRVDDFIRRGPSQFVPGTPNELRQVYENAPEAFSIRGGELTLSATPRPGLSLSAAWAHRDLSLPASDPAAAYAPENRLLLTAGWTPGRFSFELAASHASSYTVSAPEIFGVRPQPSYELLDGAVRYFFPVHNGRIGLGLVGRNLTDSHAKETLVDDNIDTSLRGRVLGLELRADF